MIYIDITKSVLQIRAGQQSITANLWPLTSDIYHVMIIVTGGFSKKCFIFRSSHTQMFFKTGVRNVAIFREKHLCSSLFWINLQALRPAILFQPHLKREFNTSVFLRILQNFYSFFYRTPPVDAFASFIRNCSVTGICWPSLLNQNKK